MAGAEVGLTLVTSVATLFVALVLVRMVFGLGMMLQVPLNHWFLRKRGRVNAAHGTISSLIISICYAPLFEWGVSEAGPGWRGTMRAVALGAVALCLPCALLLRQQSEQGCSARLLLVVPARFACGAVTAARCSSG